MVAESVVCIGGPLHGRVKSFQSVSTFTHTTTGPSGLVRHKYTRELYGNQHKRVSFWVHPDATDAQIDHALGLADI